MSIAFTYDPQTLFANGSVAYEDELELPDNAITGPFVEMGQYQLARANAARDGWIVVEDYRYAPVVDGNGNPVCITDVGPLPEGCRVVRDDDPDVVARKLKEAHAAKLAEVMAGYSAAFAPIEAIYPREERETWPIQLEEARAVLADPDAETPMLSIMVAVRGKGETIAEFAGVVMANNTMYRQFAAYITGQQQRMYAEVNALETLEAVTAYEVRYDMPSGLAG